jgi:homoserine kinase
VVNRVRVSVPATSANLGPGFDAIGVALDLRGEVVVAVSGATETREASVDADRGKAMAREAIDRVFRHLDRRAPAVETEIRGDVPVARGLGSSAIVRTGAAMAAFSLAGEAVDEEWLLELVTELEGHADNAAPALLGGLQVVSIDDGRVTHVRVPIPTNLRAALFIPDFEMSTDEGRSLLPNWWRSLEPETSRAIAIQNGARESLLIAALATGQFEALAIATRDQMHQPARSALFPAMYKIMEAAIDAGALCAYLSGGGSTILAMTESRERGIADAMAQAGAGAGVGGSTCTTKFSDRGAEILAPDREN